MNNNYPCWGKNQKNVKRENELSELNLLQHPVPLKNTLTHSLFPSSIFQWNFPSLFNLHLQTSRQVWEIPRWTSTSFIPTRNYRYTRNRQVLLLLLLLLYNFHTINFTNIYRNLLCFSCLPPDLEGAVIQSSQATASFVSSGGMRAIVCSQSNISFSFTCFHSIFNNHLNYRLNF